MEKSKAFQPSKSLREFSTTKPALQQMLMDFIVQDIQEKEKKIYKINPN